MNTDYLNAALAEKVMATFAVGDTIRIELDGITTENKILEKSFFGLTVQRPTNKVTISVAHTEAYRKELEAMTRVNPAAVPTETRGPGRPRGPRKAATGPAVAPELPAQQQRPAHQFLPPGSPGAPPAAAPWAPPATAAPAAPWAPGPSQEARPEASTEDTLAWAHDQITAAVDQFAADLKNIIDAVAADAAESATPAPAEPPPPRIVKTLTCADCQNVNIPLDICDLFKQKPPIKVIAAPKENCPSFKMDAILDDEIPY